MKRHKIKGCKAKALEILKAVKCCKKNNLKAPMPALSAEFIAEPEPQTDEELIRERVWLPENLRKLKGCLLLTFYCSNANMLEKMKLPPGSRMHKAFVNISLGLRRYVYECFFWRFYD